MASSAIATMIFFIATLLAASVVSLVFVNSINEQDNALNSQSDMFTQKFTTDFSIENIGYNEGPAIAVVYLKNSGKEKINPEKIDIYVEGTKVDKCTDYLVEVTTDTEVIDSEYFNPTEVLRIAFITSENLTSSTLFTITDSHGNRKVLNTTPIETTENPVISPTGIC